MSLDMCRYGSVDTMIEAPADAQLPARKRENHDSTMIVRLHTPVQITKRGTGRDVQIKLSGKLWGCRRTSGVSGSVQSG